MTRKIGILVAFISLLGALFAPSAIAVPIGPLADTDGRLGVAAPGLAGLVNANDDGAAITDEPVAPVGRETPRIMLDEFSTTPTPVIAGDEFTAVFTIKNMSAKYGVRNIKATLQSGEGSILPTSGAASTYVSYMAPWETARISIGFTSLSSLEDKPYQMQLDIEYEDNEFNSYSTSETVAVVVSQPPRVEASVPVVTPSELVLGIEGSLMFTVNNLGKSDISNVKASIVDGQGIWASETFVGNVAAGSTANVDMIVRAENVVDGPVALTVSYEDSSGTVSTIERDFDVIVLEEDPYTDMYPEDSYDDTEVGGIAWTPIGFAIAALLAAAVIAVGVMGKRRSKKEAEVEADALTYLDEPIEGELVGEENVWSGAGPDADRDVPTDEFPGGPGRA